MFRSAALGVGFGYRQEPGPCEFRRRDDAEVRTRVVQVLWLLMGGWIQGRQGIKRRGKSGSWGVGKRRDAPGNGLDAEDDDMPSELRKDRSQNMNLIP